MPTGKVECQCNILCTADLAWAIKRDGVWCHHACGLPLRESGLKELLRLSQPKSPKGGYKPSVHFEYETGYICCMTVPYLTYTGIKVTTTDPYQVTCRLCLRHPRRTRAIVETTVMPNLEAVPLPTLQKVVGCIILDAKELGRTKQDFSMIELLSIAEALKDAARWRYVREHSMTFGHAVEQDLPAEEFQRWVDEQMSKSSPAPAGIAPKS